eukprot:Em0001g3217a
MIRSLVRPRFPTAAGGLHHRYVETCIPPAAVGNLGLGTRLDELVSHPDPNATGDGQQSDPLVTETNSVTAAATEEIECSDHSDKCETTCSEMVAPDSNEPEITTQQGASTMNIRNMTSNRVEKNIEEPDLEVLSLPHHRVTQYENPVTEAKRRYAGAHLPQRPDETHGAPPLSEPGPPCNRRWPWRSRGRRRQQPSGRRRGWPRITRTTPAIRGGYPGDMMMEGGGEQDLEADLQGEVVKTTLLKMAAGFGFTIIGGDRPGELLQIKTIQKWSAADKDGRLQVGDVHQRDIGPDLQPPHGGGPLQELPHGLHCHAGGAEGIPFARLPGRQAAPLHGVVQSELPTPVSHTSRRVQGAEPGNTFQHAVMDRGPVVKQIMDHPRCSQLREGDIIMEVNGESVHNYLHSDLVSVLKRCPKGNQANFGVIRPAIEELPNYDPGDYVPGDQGVEPFTLLEVRLIRQVSGFGFRIIGGKGEGSLEEFSLHYSSVDDAVGLLCTYGTGAIMAKIDLKSAFRMVPVCPADWDLLGMFCDGMYYVETCRPLGLKSAPCLFNHFADARHWVLATNYHIDAVHYLDDYLLVGAAGWGFLLPSRNWRDHPHKSPSWGLSWIQRPVDCHSPRTSCVISCRWSSPGESKKCELLSLIGKLSFATKIVPAGRLFLRRLIDLSTTMSRLHHHIWINTEARADLAWWARFLPSWNGIAMFLDPGWISVEMLNLFTDASCTHGFGDYFNGSWFRGSWLPHQELPQCSIQWQELFTIVAAAHVWVHKLAGHRIRFHCDNQAVVHAWSEPWPGSTTSTYKVGIQWYLIFCKALDLAPVPSTKRQVALFATHLSSSSRLPTIRVYLAAVSFQHHVGGHRNPVSGNSILKLVLRGIRRKQTQSQCRTPRLPIPPQILADLLEHLGHDSTIPSRDRLMLKVAISLAFFGFLPVSELTVPAYHTSHQFLARRDIQFLGHQLMMFLTHSKTDQFGQGSVITVGCIIHIYCPNNGSHYGLVLHRLFHVALFLLLHILVLYLSHLVLFHLVLYLLVLVVCHLDLVLNVAKVVLDVAKVVLDVGKVVLDVAKVVLDVAKVVLDVAKVVLDVGKVVPDVGKVVLDVAKVVLDVGKVVLDVAKVVLDEAKVVLDVAKVVLDVAKVVLDVAKVVLDVGKVVPDVGKVVLDVAKVVLDVAKVVLDEAKVVLDVAKVVLDVAKVVLDVVKVVLDVAKVVLDVAKVVLDVAKVVLDVAKVVLDVAKVVLDVVKVVLDEAKVVLDVAKVVLDVAKVVLDVAKVVLDVAKVVLDVAKVVLDVAKVVLDVVKVVLDVAKVVLDVAKVVLDVAKVVLDVAKVVLDVAKVVLDVAKVVLDVGKVVLDVAKVVLDVGKVVLDVAKVVLDVGKVVLDVGKVVLDGVQHCHHLRHLPITIAF